MISAMNPNSNGRWYGSWIHDEIIFQVAVELMDRFIAAKDMAIAQVSKDLEFAYPLSLGGAIGDNLYEAK